MRRFHRRRPRRRLNRRGFFTLILLTALVLTGLAEWRIHTVFDDVTYYQAQRMITEAVNEAVASISQEISTQESEPLVSAVQGESGSTQSLMVNSVAMNRVKSEVALRVQESLSGNHCETGIPLGTLLGSALLHGRGPSLPLRVSADGNVQVDYESSFSSAGLNQTCHRHRLNGAGGGVYLCAGCFRESSVGNLGGAGRNGDCGRRAATCNRLEWDF